MGKGRLGSLQEWEDGTPEAGWQEGAGTGVLDIPARSLSAGQSVETEQLELWPHNGHTGGLT